jgi:hypothetical protein
MLRIRLLGLAFVFFLVTALGCGGNGPKKVEENPFKARQEGQKDPAKFMMPKGVKVPKNSE